jgi:hypothetical protein
MEVAVQRLRVDGERKPTTDSRLASSYCKSREIGHQHGMLAVVVEHLGAGALPSYRTLTDNLAF